LVGGPEGAKDASTVTVGGAWSPGKVGPRVPSLRGEPSETKKNPQKKFKKTVPAAANITFLAISPSHLCLTFPTSEM